jgi:ParB-like chromosome segregation protein Spo0J|tara:strand:+ start:27123 stop:28298 length:1176 start_codon:yes stop_codon:yes gene_type:complete
MKGNGVVTVCKNEGTLKNINAILVNEVDCIKEIDQKVKVINQIKKILHSISPFKNEPVDCVLWVKNDSIQANDYNPNKVAPPEMELLKLSILADGYTQPIVTFPEKDKITVVDGFHRNRVGKEIQEVKNKIHGYLPIVKIRESQKGKNERIASTIRHNRARGKHTIDGMSEIVIELKRRNWSNKRICKELGMEEDEVLRLCQITGLAELFNDEEFSKSWDIKDSEPDFEPVTDQFDDTIKEEFGFRTVNTNDPDRIFHKYDKWECYKAGFYATKKEGMTEKECEQEYYELLSNKKEFEKALKGVIEEWKYSCEHYLTNQSMNRIAYLGQAALCYSKGIPSKYRGGFNLLDERQQKKANNLALKYLNKWLKKNGRKEVKLDEAMTERQSTIY